MWELFLPESFKTKNLFIYSFCDYFRPSNKINLGKDCKKINSTQGMGESKKYVGRVEWRRKNCETTLHYILPQKTARATSPKSEGVMLKSMTNKGWQNRYYGKLRIVSPAKPIAQTHVLKWDNSGYTPFMCGFLGTIFTLIYPCNLTVAIYILIRLDWWTHVIVMS